MRLSPNTRYAIRILLELSSLSKPVSSAYLAEKTGMTLRTVENIHAVLRQEGLTAGTVGAKGGITLLGSLKAISLGQLIAMFDEGVLFSVCCGDKANDCPNQAECDIRNVWRTVSREIQGVLDAISLETILQKYPKGLYGPLLSRYDPSNSVTPNEARVLR